MSRLLSPQAFPVARGAGARPGAHRTAEAWLFVACCLLLCALAALILLLPTAHAAPPAGHPLTPAVPTVLPVASYTMDVSLDDQAKTIAGHQIITYTNTTTEPIPDLVFHLYLNAFRDEDSLFLQEGGAGHRGFGWDPEHAGWIEVTAIHLAGGTPLELEEIADGTLARAGLPVSVAPGEQIQIELDFVAQLPRVFARTGYAGDFFMVGQWFPKLGVWQDGAWNAYPFHANAEFYADFGTYDVTLHLPAGYVTGGTGLPLSVRDNGDGTQTVRYHAEHVIDFAWTACPRFQQATRQVDGIEVLYLFLPEHAWSVERALDAAAAALRHYQQWYGPYAYQRLTIVDVPDDGQGASGMEYPTLITAGTLDPFEASWSPLQSPSVLLLEEVVVHEIGHQWWQSMVAFNEAEEPWLDEGFTDYSGVRVMDAVYGPGASFLRSPYLKAGSADLRRAQYLGNPRVPMYGRAWDFGPMEYGIAAYAKPVIALRTLEGVLGEEMMLKIMSTFFQRYRFAHPTTEDFRTVAEEVSGQDLAWFFDGLVYGDGVLNYTVTALDEDSVTVARQGELRIPTELLVTFAGGDTVLEPWAGYETERTFVYPGHPPVRSAEIDPEGKLAVDLQWSDNGLSQRLAVAPWLALVTRLIYNLQNLLLAMGGL